MTTNADSLAGLLDSIEILRIEIGRLHDRLAALEAAQRPAPSTPAAPPKPAPLTEELVLVIGAAVAAFLGKKAHVRQIRLLGTSAWSTQGRVTIQASHNQFSE
ncbi:MAG: hypothetical protein U0840_13630 [Gemmataceae bacterium]